MAYGRLDVFWPDGRFETYMLDADNVTIGRHPDNVITLETDSISRLHFCIRYERGVVSIVDMDSSNGTYVDGRRLPSNEPHVLDGTEEIVAGHLRMIFNPVDDSPTLPMSALGEETQRIAKEAQTFKLDVEEPMFAIPPGAHTTATINVTNTGDETRRFVIVVENLPEGWARLSRPEALIDPGETTSIPVNFKPVRRSESAPGDYRAIVRVYPKDKPEVALTAELVVKVLPYSGFGIALGRDRVPAGEPLRIHLHNQGNDYLPLKLSIRDRSGNLRVNLPTEKVRLSAGQRLQVNAELRSKRTRIIGPPIAHAFDVLAQAETPAGWLTSIRGYFIDMPMLPYWAAGLIGGAVLLLAILLIAGIISLSQPREPIITTFELSATEIPQGEPLIISWQAEDASAYSLRVNGTVVWNAGTAETQSFELDTTNLLGDVNVQLEAHNGDLMTTDSRWIYVYEPLELKSFTVEPDTLMRNVVSELTITWEVDGAVLTRISGLDAFSTTPVNTTAVEDGLLSGISGIPTTPFTLTLYAEDEVGNSLESQIAIAVIDARCISTAPVNLHIGPGDVYNVVSSIPADQSITVEARDGSGQWLQTFVAGETPVWGRRDAFNCVGFNPDALRVELNVPPTPQPTPTNTPTTTPTLPPTPTPSPTATPPPTATPSAAPPQASPTPTS